MFTDPSQNVRFNSIYFGGGTPSVMNLEQIQRILNSVSRRSNISNLPFTFEMHPKNVSEDYLSGLVKTGVTRISIGFQNSNLHEREVLNRNITTPQQDMAALESIKQSGLPFNVDLMYGTPDQTLESWSNTLKSLVNQVKPPEITTYLYINIPGTGTDAQIRKRLLSRPSFSLRSQMYNHAIHFLNEKGYFQVGAMSFSLSPKPDRRAQLKENGFFLGLGPGAYSNLGDKIFINNSQVRQFIDGDNDNFIAIKRNLLFKGAFDLAYNNLINNIALARSLRFQQLQPEIVSQVYGIYYAIQKAYMPITTSAPDSLLKTPVSIAY